MKYRNQSVDLHYKARIPDKARINDYNGQI